MIINHLLLKLNDNNTAKAEVNIRQESSSNDLILITKFAS